MESQRNIPSNKISPKTIGIICIIMSAFFFALMNAFVRLSGNLPSVQKSFFRNLVAFFFAFIILYNGTVKNIGLNDKKAFIKEMFAIPKGNLIFLILRATFGTIGILCNFYAIDHLVLSDASMLNKMSPFFAIIFSYLIIKEKVSFRQAVYVTIAFLGSLLVIKPSFSNAALLPSILGLIGGMGAGIAYTMVRILGNRGQKGSFIVFFFSGFSCLVTLPYLIFCYHEMSLIQIVFLILAGLSAAGGQFSITAAYMHAPAAQISIYDYSQIIFTTILGFLLFAQVPDTLSIIGYVIICSMAILNTINRDK